MMNSPFIRLDDYTEMIRMPSELPDHFKDNSINQIESVHERYPILANNYYLGLINKENHGKDPICQQCIPSVQELTNPANLNCDGLNESSYMPVKHLIHRYPDRALLITTNQCAVLCRFCFRKRLWRNGTKHYITEVELDQICNYLASKSEIKDVLLSGGDPLMLTNEYLEHIFRKISVIKHIETIRLCTRIPVTLPARIDDSLIQFLKKIPSLWVMTHFNHPNELSDLSMTACSNLIKNGIPVLNQTVLLKGINDKAETLETLFRRLIKFKVKPHYLFHIDPVAGASHFATGPEKGLAIMKELRKKLSSIALPTFAIDLPGGGGKVPLLPNYQNDEGQYETLSGNYCDYPF